MNKQHLIALDLDGTLLTDNKIISTRTKHTIAKAKEQGHVVVISTGRPFRASYDYYKELGLNTPIVNFNGAYVHHPLDSNWGIHHSPLELATAQEIVRACFDFGVKIYTLKLWMMCMFVKLMKIKTHFRIRFS